MGWKDEFIEMFMAGDLKNFSAALELKREHIPKRLYRYRSAMNCPNIIEEICEGEIYLAHPDDMNDPFDACSLMGSRQPAHYFSNQETFRSGLQQHFGDEILEQIFQSPNWYDELMHLVASESAPNNTAEQEKIVQALVYVSMKALADVNKSFNKMVHMSSRFACFTTKPDNLPMWNHYAQSCSGVCLEYDPQDITNVYMINRLFPVLYVDKLPDVVERTLGKQEREFGLMDYFLIHKLKDWSYENEWRLIYNVGSWYFAPEDVPESFWKQGKKIQFVRPKRVLLGPKIEEQYEKLIRDASGYYEIPVVKMLCTEYGLQEISETQRDKTTPLPQR